MKVPIIFKSKIVLENETLTLLYLLKKHKTSEIFE